MSRPGRFKPTVMVTVTLVIIAVLTLRPVEMAVPLPALCVFCGQLGGVDFVLNTALFVPLGIGLRWLTGRSTMPILIGAAVTLVIESLQWRAIPGRDASLGDLLANTLGTAIGVWLAVEGSRLAAASPERVRRLGALCTALVASVMLLSAVLLLPMDPTGAQYVQWTPERPGRDVFRGRLVAVQLNGRLLLPREAHPSQWVYDSVTRAMAVRAVVRTPVPPTARQAIIVRIANELHEGFMLAQRGDALVFRSTTWAARLKLRPLLIAANGALEPRDGGSDTTRRVLMLVANSNPRAMTVGAEDAAGSVTVTVRRSVGLGWTLLLPWDIPVTPQWWIANAAWLAALVFPVAFLTMRSSHKSTVGRDPRLYWWRLAVLAACLVVAPAALGLSVLAPGEWLGVAVGIAAGVFLERRIASPLSNVEIAARTPTRYP